MVEFRVGLDASEFKKFNSDFKVSIKEWKDMLKSDIKRRDETTSATEFKDLTEQIKMLKNVIKSETGGGTSGKSSGMGGFGKMAGAMAVGTAAGMALFEIAKNTTAIKKILEVVSGLINALVAPFVPIIVGFMKPFFIIFSVIANKLASFIGGLMPNTGDSTLDTAILLAEISGAIVLGLSAASFWTSISAAVSAALVGVAFWEVIAGAVAIAAAATFGVWLLEQLPKTKTSEKNEKIFSAWFDDMGQNMKDAGKLIKFTWQDFNESLEKNLTDSGIWISATFDDFKVTLSDSFSNFVIFFNELIKNTMVTIGEAIDSVINTFISISNKFIGLLVDGFNSIIGFINKLIKKYTPFENQVSTINKTDFNVPYTSKIGSNIGDFIDKITAQQSTAATVANTVVLQKLNDTISINNGIKSGNYSSSVQNYSSVTQDNGAYVLGKTVRN